MIKKELLNALKNLDAKTIINFVDNEMKEVYKKTYSNPVFGWTYSIILDSNGELWSTLLSPGSRPMEVFKGDSIILGSINSESEIESELVNLDVINNLTEEEREKFIEEFKRISNKYKCFIGGCGCCSSPYIEDFYTFSVCNININEHECTYDLRIKGDYKIFLVDK